ncbi:MAG: hypothetical protein O3A20_00295 [Planctomycetota bacterium]|nr:hypothetical protein [Planctomycetota bacterium]
MSRRLRLAALTVAVGLAGVGVAMLLLAVLARPALRLRADMTHTGGAGVSERTAAALRTLPEGSRLTVFMFPENPAWAWNGSAVYPRAFDRLISLLEDARLRAGGRLEVTLLDRTSSLLETEEAQRRLGRRPGDALFLEVGDTRKVLAFEELFQVIEPTRDGQPARLRAERLDHALGNAALALASGALPRVAIYTAARAGALYDPQQLLPLARLLTDEGFEVVDATDLRGVQDADLLVVPGQHQAFAPAELDAARAWLDAGKPLLLALGAFADERVVEDWNALLSERGAVFGSGLICEPVRTSGGVIEGDPICGHLETSGAEFDDQHAISSRISTSGRAQIFTATRPVETGAAGNAFTIARVARSEVEAWLDLPGGKDFILDGAERRGIRGIAAASEPWMAQGDAANGRLVLLGSAASLEGGRLAALHDFTAAAVRWLAGREMRDFELVATRELPFRPDRATQARIDNLAVLVLPGAAFLAAFGIFLRRRR